MRYAAFLRGVSPMNCKMPALAAALEAAGFTGVKTYLSSGNATFATPRAVTERRVEKAIEAGVGRHFSVILRPIPVLQAMLAADPFARFAIPPNAKRVVTFLRSAMPPIPLPPARDGAQILAVAGTEALSIYTPGPKGPVFMTILERAFGKDITTRTWDTVTRVARA